MSISSASTAIPDNTEFLLGLINNLTHSGVTLAGIFFVFGSTAIRLRRDIVLNPGSDIDCMLLLNGDFPLEFVIAHILTFIHSYYLEALKGLYKFADLSKDIIEIDIRESAPEQIPIGDNIMKFVNTDKSYKITDYKKNRSPGVYRWTAKSTNQYVPIKLKVIFEFDGRYLIKLLDTYTNRELLDINVYNRDLETTARQAKYASTFMPSILKVGPYEIPTASSGMILCQQIDLFHSRYLARKRGAMPREISATRKSEVRALWDSLSAEQQGAVRGLFTRPVNTYTNVFNGKEKTVIGEFLKDIGLEGGKRRQTKGKKRRSTRKTL
jgi:hypothetical protein